MSAEDFEFTAGDDTEAGQYPAILVTIERKETKDGESFRVWRFKTAAGAELSGSSSLSAGPQSKAYRWARAIIGRAPQPGERVGFLFGKPCIVDVQVNDAGFAKVVEVHPAGQPVATVPTAGSTVTKVREPVTVPADPRESVDDDGVPW